MVKRLIIVLALWLPMMFLLFIYSAPARIRFSFPSPPRIISPAVFVVTAVIDERPNHEREDYRALSADPAFDADYAGGFPDAFRDGLQRSLARSFSSPAGTRTVSIRARVRHFHGECRQPFSALIWEQAAALLLFVPRLVTDTIPYNDFTGRIAVDFEFRGRDGVTVTRRLDVSVTEKISTWRRNPRGTASLLCQAAAPEIAAMVDELVNCR